jgi:DHA2 family multidrug resistance protein-like MFS transporter
LSDKLPPPLLSTIGLGVLATGLALLAGLGPHAGPLDVIWRAAVCGAGFGFFQAPNNRELMGSAPREKSGSASGVLATVRVTGQSLGAAVVAIVLAAVARGAESQQPGIIAASHVALWLGAGCAFVAMLVSALRLRR